MNFKFKPVHAVVLGLVLVSALLAYDAFSSYLNPYLTVSEVVGEGDGGKNKFLNKEVQILATVANGSLTLREDGSLLFSLTDGGTGDGGGDGGVSGDNERARIVVEYSGVQPQGLKEGRKVVAVGTLTSPSHLNATQLLLKCPSKYE
ncbi:MAG: hypothetical protein C4B55_03620 [Candidatus Methanophagaceae archaeon]|nr:MAG: hypothetical protein C4B55_03620 [Methanophagales archaeon]